MSLSVERVATALAGTSLPTNEIATALLAKSSQEDSVTMRTEPTGSTVPAIIKSHWTKAASVARISKDPAVLDKAARHPSIVVRRLVARNEAIDAATVQRLTDHGLKKSDDELLMSLIQNESVDVETLTAKILTSLPIHGTTLRNSVVRALSHRIRDNSVLLTQMLAHPEWLVAATAWKYCAKRTTTISLQQAVESISEQFQREAAQDMVNLAEVLDDELVDLIETWDLLPRVTIDVPIWLRLMGVQKATPTAFNRMLDMRPEVLRLFPMMSVPAECLDQVIETAGGEVLRTLIRQRGSAMSPTQVARTVDRICELPMTFSGGQIGRIHGDAPFFIPGDVLDRCDIDRATVLKFLRLTSAKQMIRFVNGLAPIKPLPGEVTELVTNPGWAFGVRQKFAPNGTTTTEPTTAAEGGPDLLANYLNGVDVNNLDPWTDELVDAFGAVGVTTIFGRRTAASCAEYASDRLQRELGDNLESWTMAVNMFAKTSTSFGATCSAVRALSRIERPKAAEVEPPALVDPIAFPTDDDGQLRIA